MNRFNVWIKADVEQLPGREYSSVQYRFAIPVKAETHTEAVATFGVWMARLGRLATQGGNMTDRPSPDMLDGWLKLADLIDENGGAQPIDVEALLEQSAQAARGLRSLVKAVRAAEQPGKGRGEK